MSRALSPCAPDRHGHLAASCASLSLSPEDLDAHRLLKGDPHDSGIGRNPGPKFYADNALIYQHSESVERDATSRFGLAQEPGTRGTEDDIGNDHPRTKR